MEDGIVISQLTTDHICCVKAPLILANIVPLPIVIDFNSTLVAVTPVHKTNRTKETYVCTRTVESGKWGVLRIRPIFNSPKSDNLKNNAGKNNKIDSSQLHCNIR